MVSPPSPRESGQTLRSHSTVHHLIIQLTYKSNFVQQFYVGLVVDIDHRSSDHPLGRLIIVPLHLLGLVVPRPSCRCSARLVDILCSGYLYVLLTRPVFAK